MSNAEELAEEYATGEIDQVPKGSILMDIIKSYRLIGILWLLITKINENVLIYIQTKWKIFIILNKKI